MEIWCYPGHFREEISIQTLADYTHCHPTTVMNAFKRRHDCTVMHYVTQLRLAEAARLLVADRQVLDIALSVGFHSVSTRLWRSLRPDH